MESTDIIDRNQLFEKSTFKDLLDIRDCLAYKDYLAFNGKDQENMSQNGYKPVKLTNNQKMEEELRKKNPVLAAQIARRQKDEERLKEEQSACMQIVMNEAPPLNVPDFIHFQEMFNPIFRIDLNVKSYKKILSQY